ncbi:MAG: DUF4468 domain-containing protein [Cytophagales bacterium]|nr:MAG: DUF4468 domain-containing protein [Cytophagales bacterium]
MKITSTLIFLSIFLSFSIFSQELPIDSETQKVTFSEVVPLESVNKEELYKRALEWSKKNTKVEDNKTDAKYISKVAIKSKYPAPMKGYFHDGEIIAKVTISCKEGKYKYEITDITHSSSRGSGGNIENKIPECGKYTLTLEGWGVIKNQAKIEIPKIIETIKQAMQKASPTASAKSKEDW